MKVRVDENACMAVKRKRVHGNSHHLICMPDANAGFRIAAAVLQLTRMQLTSSRYANVAFRNAANK